MFDLGGGILHLDVGHCVGPALVSDQQRVALGEILRPVGGGQYLHQAPVGAVAMARGNPLGNDGAPGVLAFVNHLGAGVGLLVIVDQRHRVELANRVVAFQDHAGVFPGDGRTGLHLRPRNLGALVGDAAFGHEIVDPTVAVFVPREPVLKGGVLDLGVIQGHQFDHCGVELVGLPGRGGAAFQIADVRALFGDDQGPLELAGVGLVDAEVGHQLNGAAHTLGDVDE